MVRIFRVIEVRQVAGGAIGRSAPEDVVLVTICARRRTVRPCQRELRRRAVIELSPLPLSHVVADRAILREAGRCVVGIAHPVIGWKMAGGTGNGGRGERTAGMTACAAHGGMGAGQRELRKAVVEFGVLPTAGRVTVGAVCGETALLVVRVRRRFKNPCVAAKAVYWRAGVTTGKVALVAARGRVGACQRELRACIVIKSGSGPGGGVVAGRAFPGEARLHMVGISGSGKVVCVATVAVRRSASETPARVAVHTVGLRMGPDECKAGESGMIKSRTLPGVEPVTLFAFERQFRRLMVRSPGGSVILGMTGDAVGAQTREPARCRTFVARVAIDCRMSPQQGEAVLVLLHGLERNTPAPNCVALLALAAKLLEMQVRMTIGAFCAYIAEDQLYMTLPAIHRDVQPSKWKPCFVMGEIRNGPNGPPTGGGVAILAGNCQKAVWASRGALHRLSRRGLKTCPEACHQQRGQGRAPDAKATGERARRSHGEDRWAFASTGPRTLLGWMMPCEQHSRPQFPAARFPWHALQSRGVDLYMTTILPAISVRV